MPRAGSTLLEQILASHFASGQYFTYSLDDIGRYDRAIRTSSSEQVRQPIYRNGINHWRHFEPWLDPLKQALGPVLEACPAVPGFDPSTHD